MGLKEIETPNAMISYFAEQLGPLIEKSEIKQPTYLYWELMRKAEAEIYKEKSSARYRQSYFVGVSSRTLTSQ